MLIPAIALRLIVSAGLTLHPAAPVVQRAIARQVDSQVARHWAGAHIVWSNSPKAIPVHILSLRAVASTRWCGAAAGGCHWAGRGGRPVIAVGAQPQNWSGYLSHEVIETVIDPSGARELFGKLAEACDPVAQSWYRLDGIWVSDFVYPRWFVAGSAGPFDYLHATRRAGRVATGGYPDSLDIKAM